MAKREPIQPNQGDKRRRDDGGHFIEEKPDGRSPTQDRRQPAKRATPRGQGDRGDRKSATK
jgi:hypothetical protein